MAKTWMPAGSIPRLAAISLLSTLPAIFADPAFAADACTPVPLSKAAIVVTGTAPPDDPLCYALAPAPGQSVHIALTSGRNVALTVGGVADAVDAIDLEGRARPYQLFVAQLMRSVTDEDFQLDLTVSGQAPAAPAENASADNAATAASEPGAVAEIKSDLRSVQQRLGELGYYDGPVNGRLDRRTMEAIRNFELAAGLPPTGRTSPGLGQALAAAPAAQSAGAPAAISQPAEPVAEAAAPPPPAPAAAEEAAVAPDAGPAPPPATGQLPLAVQEGLVFVGDRLLAGLSNRNMTPAPDAFGKEVDLATNTAIAVFRHALPRLDQSRIGEDGFIRFYPFFAVEDRYAILEATFQQALDDKLRRQHVDVLQGVRSLDIASQFERRRAAEAIRVRFSRLFRPTVPSPMKTRVYCGVDFDPYDFNREAFPIRNLNCMKPVGKIPVTDGANYSIAEVPAPQGGWPKEIPLPPDTAERFAETVSGLVPTILSYETALTVEITPTATLPTVTVTASRPENFVVHEPGDMSRVAFALKRASEAPAKSAAAGAPGELRWIERAPLDRQPLAREVLALGGGARDLPFPGQSLLSNDGAGKTLVLEFMPLLKRNRSDSVPESLRKYGTMVRNAEAEGKVVGLRGIERDAFGMALADGLGVDRTRVAAIAWENPKIYALLPAPVRSFTFAPPDDFYGAKALGSEITFGVTGAATIRTGKSETALVLGLMPREGRFLEITDQGVGPVVAAVDFSAAAASAGAAGEVIATRTRIDHLRAIAEANGLDARALLAANLETAEKLDDFARRDLVERILAAPIAQASDDIWVAGTIRFGNYDFDAGVLKVSAIDYRPMDVRRQVDLKSSALRFRLANEADLSPKLSPDEAKRLTDLAGRRDLQLRMRFAPIKAVDYYSGVLVDVRVVEAEILDKDGTPTVRDPSHVVFRYALDRPAAKPAPEASAAPGSPAGAMAGLKLGRLPPPAESVQLISAFLGEDPPTSFIMKRKDVDRITRMFAVSHVNLSSWRTMIETTFADLPTTVIYVKPDEAAGLLEADPGTGFLVSTPDAIGMARVNVGPADVNVSRYVAQLVATGQMSLFQMPTGKPSAATNIDDLVGKDAQYVVISRRGAGPPWKRVVADKGSWVSARLQNQWVGNRLPEDVVFTPEIDMTNSEPLLAGDLLSALSGDPATLVVLKRDGLEALLSHMNPEDFVFRRFPVIELQFGIKKDHKQGPADFKILEVTVGMDADAVAAALAAEFEPTEIERTADAVIASEGNCSNAFSEKVDAADIGARCFRADLEGGVVRSIQLWQVYEGDIRDKAEEALIKRYRNHYNMRERRFLDRGGQRLLIGWGAELNTTRADLGRTNAVTPPTGLEAIVLATKAATVISVRIDDAKTKLEQEPKIKL